MPILIDREQMCVRYRHGNENIIWNIMALEFTHTAVVSMNENVISEYERFTDYELKMLYLNLCGQKYTGYARDILMTTVKDLVQSLPESDLNGFELAVQVRQMVDAEHYFYRYLKGSQVPEIRTEAYIPPALTSVAGYTPVPVTTPAANAAPAPHTTAASTPRNPSAVTLPPEAPKAGSKTGEVWRIAEIRYKQMLEDVERLGVKFDAKELRKSIVALCEAEGINSSTASVQFGKWRTTKTF